MARRSYKLFVLLIVLVIAACKNNSSENETGYRGESLGNLFKTFEFNGKFYVETNESIKEVGNKLGEASGKYSGVEIFEVPGKSPDQSVAVKSDTYYFLAMLVP